MTESLVVAVAYVFVLGCLAAYSYPLFQWLDEEYRDEVPRRKWLGRLDPTGPLWWAIAHCFPFNIARRMGEVSVTLKTMDRESQLDRFIDGLQQRHSEVQKAAGRTVDCRWCATGEDDQISVYQNTVDSMHEHWWYFHTVHYVPAFETPAQAEQWMDAEMAQDETVSMLSHNTLCDW